MNLDLKEQLYEYYLSIYKDEETINQLFEKLDVLLKKYEKVEPKQSQFSENDSILITYGDSLKNGDEPGIKVLNEFLKRNVKDAMSSVHLLPMFPYTSDDGFSVVDYKKINPELGSWEDVADLSENYSLMFDAVVNHISKSSEWFKKFENQEKPYDQYFIVSDPDDDYSTVTRPRALPLLNKYKTVNGDKYLWTTFSEDQIDLNYKCIDVYLEVLDTLLYYAMNGARFIRLDAIGYLWKELGTSCIHLPETHAIIKSYRAILEKYAKGTMFVTETNVPHKENISYFGNGNDEAHMIYQFPLPPLTMFSILTGNAKKMMEWADKLDEPTKGTTYFNFLSSHDGIGIRPTEGILTAEEQQILVDATLKNGGVVSYKDNGDGTKSPYEMNINYQDALASPDDSDEVRINRFLAAETILLSMQGIPGIYIHSLLGSRNDYYGKTVSGIPRRINREKIDVNYLNDMLCNGSNRQIIFEELIRRLNIRKSHKAFSPNSSQKVLFKDERVFAIERKCEIEKIIVLVNVSSEEVITDMKKCGYDCISGKKTENIIHIKPYQCMWILEENE